MKKSTNSTWILLIFVMGMVISGYVWTNAKTDERMGDVVAMKVEQGIILNEIRNINKTLQRLENKNSLDSSFLEERLK